MIARRHYEAPRPVGASVGEDAGVCSARLAIGGPPQAVARAIDASDSATRSRIVGQLQQQVGNLAVSRLLAPAANAPDPAALPVQRWAVTLPPGSSDCNVVVSWMNQNSPYRTLSGWALTSPTFGWGGDFAYSGSGASQTVAMTSPSVTLNTTVDMPAWSPTNPTMKQAWRSMSTDLRAHEARHEAVADTWKATLLSRLTGLSLPIKRQADGPAAVKREWASWLVEHQADQSALDPYSALLDCSGGTDEAAQSDSTGPPTPVAEMPVAADEGATAA